MVTLILTVETKAGSVDSVKFVCDCWEHAELTRRAQIRRGNLAPWAKILTYKIEW